MTGGAAQLSDLVLRHRDSPSPVLRNEMPLLRLLDKAGCQMLSQDLSAHGPWEVRKAGRQTWEMIPDEPGLYMFVWRPWFRFDVSGGRPVDLEQVLYAGMAGAGKYAQSTLRSRYKSGYAKYFPGDPELLWEPSEVIMRNDRLERFLSLEPLEYWFTVISDRGQIGLLEDRLLQLLNPLINQDRIPKLVRKPSRPAFTRP